MFQDKKPTFFLLFKNKRMKLFLKYREDLID